MNLHQLNMSFDAREDRLLLKVSTDTHEEFRFWLTRRLVRLAWPQIVKLMEATVPVAKAKAPLEFRHAEAVEKTDFKTPYATEPVTAAMAGEPLLVSTLSLTPLASGGIELVLSALDRGSVNLKLPSNFLHALVKLLQDTAGYANWNLSLNLPSAPMASMAIN